MVKLSMTKVVGAVGGVALSLAVGSGVASANPDPAIVNTSCNYNQVVSALNAQSPDAAARFNGSPMAQHWLSKFLAAPPDQREQMVTQAESMPAAQPYLGLVSQVANTCNNY